MRNGMVENMNACKNLVYCEVSLLGDHVLCSVKKVK